MRLMHIFVPKIFFIDDFPYAFDLFVPKILYVLKMFLRLLNICHTHRMSRHLEALRGREFSSPFSSNMMSRNFSAQTSWGESSSFLLLLLSTSLAKTSSGGDPTRSLVDSTERSLGSARGSAISSTVISSASASPIFCLSRLNRAIWTNSQLRMNNSYSADYLIKWSRYVKVYVKLRYQPTIGKDDVLTKRALCRGAFS